METKYYIHMASFAFAVLVIGVGLPTASQEIDVDDANDACKVYLASDAGVPDEIRMYLEAYRAPSVSFCPWIHEYYADTEVSRVANICHFQVVELEFTETTPRELRPLPDSAVDFVYLSYGDDQCPAPERFGYTALLDVSLKEAERILRLFERNNIVPSQNRRAFLMRRDTQFGIWKSYSVNVDDGSGYGDFRYYTVWSFFDRFYFMVGTGIGHR